MSSPVYKSVSDTVCLYMLMSVCVVVSLNLWFLATECSVVLSVCVGASLKLYRQA